MNGFRRRPSDPTATGSARSLGSGGSDGTRKAGPAAVILLLLAALPALASPRAEALAHLESRAGDVRQAAATLAATAGAVATAGRLGRIERIEGDAEVLAARIRRLSDARLRLEASLPAPSGGDDTP